MSRLADALAGIADWIFERIAPIRAPYDDPAVNSFGPDASRAEDQADSVETD